MKKTAVEWYKDAILMTENSPKYNEWAFNKAKELEKKQIIKVFMDVNKELQETLGNKLTLKDLLDYKAIAEVYYNEEFKTEKQ
jgi:hypothetical protein